MTARTLRSLLFVPGDSARKLERALQCPADALVLDLEDSVHVGAKAEARQVVSGALARGAAQYRIVRVNALDSGLVDDDLAALRASAPDAVMLPKCGSLADIETVVSRMDALGLPPIPVLPVATESARALRNLMRSDWSHPRLLGLTWGAEDIAADVGALANREDDGFTGIFRLAREVCLLAAREAGVLAFDTVYVDVRDPQGCLREASRAYRWGFDGMMALHPAQVEVIHAAFAPTAAELDWARRVLDVLDRAGQGVGVLDGRMIDRPHRRAAERMLRLAAPSA